MSAGQVVGGRWLLGQELGHGAFGQVFAAEDQSAVSLGQAAIKVMHPSTSPRERAGFHEEIRKVVALRHQNLVAYLDSGEYVDEEGSAHLYLVTELCQYSLQDWLDRASGGLAPEQAERLMHDISAGLGYLHGRSTLHRDLKPGNVLLGGPDWKLADFGLSRDLSATGHYHHGDQLMGTPRYMSPELFERGAAAPAADVYAVGVTLHQALTGRPVHEASTDVALIVAITTQPPAIDPSLPPEWRHLIGRCLDRDPARRPAAADLPAVLAEGRAGAGGGPANATVAVGHQFMPGGPGPGAAALGAAAGLAGSQAPGGPFTPGAQYGAGVPYGSGGPGAVGFGTDPRVGSGGPATWNGAPSTGGPYSPPAGDRGPEGFTRPVPFQSAGKSGSSRGLLIGVVAAVAAVAILGGALLLANRGGDDETATTGSTPPGTAQPGADATTSTTGSAGGAGTTVDPATATAAAQQKVKAITPGQADAPGGYATTVDPGGSPELCTGIEPVRLARPPLAEGGVAYDSTAQSFVVRTLAYGSVEAAQAAYDYAAGLAAACDAKPLGADAPDQVWDITPDPTVVVPQAEQSSAAAYSTLGGAVSSTVLTIYTRVGDTIVQSSGSDRATTIYYAQLALSRLTSQQPPLKVEPSGAVGDLTGGTAGNMRQFLLNSPDASEGVKAWLGTHTNADIDTIGASACLALNASDTQDQLGIELLAQYSALDPAVRGDLGPEDYGSMAGAGAVFYCADEAQRLGLA